MTLSFVTPISFILTVLLLLSAVTPALSVVQKEDPASRQLSSAEKQAQSHVKAGQQLYKSNKLPEAIVELKKAVELQPKNPEYRNQLATAHFHNNDMKQMWSELRQGAQLDPSHKLILQKGCWPIETRWTARDCSMLEPKRLPWNQF